MTATSLSDLGNPYRTERRAAELYFQLIAVLLGHQHHYVALDYIGPDNAGEWNIRCLCAHATIEFLIDLAESGGDRNSLLWLIA
jgi:hypothetical protein